MTNLSELENKVTISSVKDAPLGKYETPYFTEHGIPIMEVVYERTKPLSEITPHDIPRGWTAEDVALDYD